MKECLSCHYLNDDQSHFCENCGLKLESNQKSHIFCDQCGMPNEEGSLFCQACGHRLSDNTLEANGRNDSDDLQILRQVEGGRVEERFESSSLDDLTQEALVHETSDQAEQQIELFGVSSSLSEFLAGDQINFEAPSNEANQDSSFNTEEEIPSRLDVEIQDKKKRFDWTYVILALLGLAVVGYLALNYFGIYPSKKNSPVTQRLVTETSENIETTPSSESATTEKETIGISESKETETSVGQENLSSTANSSQSRDVVISDSNGNSSTSNQSTSDVPSETESQVSEETTEDVMYVLSNEEIAEIVQNTFGSIKGNHSIYIQQLNVEGQVLDEAPYIQNDIPIRGAATIQLFILLAFYDAVISGEISADDIYVLHSDEMVGQIGNSDVFTPDKIGTSYTYRDLARTMIVNSDNLAANILIHILGGTESIQTRMNKYGFNRSQINGPLHAYASLSGGIGNNIVNAEVGELLGRMYRKELVSPGASEEMLQFLSAHQDNSMLTSNLPIGSWAYHMTGTFDDYGVKNDSAIIETEKGVFIVSVLSESGNSDEQLGQMKQLGTILTNKFNELP